MGRGKKKPHVLIFDRVGEGAAKNVSEEFLINYTFRCNKREAF